jgi:beta-galactosidase
MFKMNRKMNLRLSYGKFFIPALLFYSSIYAQNAIENPFTEKLDGFYFGNKQAPNGDEWQSPTNLSFNKELPRSYFFSFENQTQAQKVLPENSPYWINLNGTWKFNWVKTPEERPKNFFENSFDTSTWADVPVPMSWNIYGIQKNGDLKYGVPIYVNQKVIFQHSVKVDDWKGGVMREPNKDWTTYVYRNEVGSFKRNFTIPKNWKDREVYINFDGVDSFFYLWINGKYVGFSKNSRNLASFNISPYLNNKGENTVALEVYRNSDASYLEAQDMFRLPGISRTVSLTSKPKVQIRDLVVIPDVSSDYKDGELTISADIRNSSTKVAKDYKVVYSLYKNKLYSDETEKVNNFELINNSTNTTINSNSSSQDKKHIKLKNVDLWSAEEPYRYTLVAELKDAKNKTIETISTTTGFRKVEIKETVADKDEFGLAGRYFYVNGKTVKLKGVNRHETNPEKGKVVTHQQMEDEIKLMKRANINHVRNSHYSDDPYWYFLCDKFGIYLEDEANLESHEYYYGAASLSHPKEWEAAHVARNLEMVHATINHPSIVIWSLGNEAGPGNNFVEAYKAIKKVDISRPVQYERNNAIVDMGSNQYPSINWVQGAVKGNYNLKYPFHISEYAHSMGNATGNLIDYWNAIESTNYFMGGAIWDWIDQAMYYYDKKTGEKFFAYGGDFGDKPNDGTFVNNGLIFANLKEKPAYWEVKKVYQNIGIKANNIEKGEVEIFNKNYFTSLDQYDIEWSLYQDGNEIKRSSTFNEPIKSIGPREKQIVRLPIQFDQLNPTSEYFAKIQLKQKYDQLWAPKGYVQMEEQIFVKAAEQNKSIAEIQQPSDFSISDEGQFKSIIGKNFAIKFDNKTGSIYSLNYNNQTIIQDGNGPKLDAYRSPVDNDNWAYQQWFQKGLHNLKHKVLSTNSYKRNDGALVIFYTVESQAPNSASLLGGTSGNYTIEEHKNEPFGENDFKFTTNQVWTIYQDGSIELSSSITSNDESLALARLGYELKLSESLSNYTYYGRGPINNYADRKTAQNIEVHKSTVKDQYVDWPNPQSMSNNEEVRWSSVTDNSGNGVVFVSKNPMATSVLPWSELQLTLASHPYKLPKSNGTYLHLDAGVTGLGGNSCGQGPPLDKDQVHSNTTTFGFIIRPIKQNNFAAQTNVKTAGDNPLVISRNKAGEVSIVSENPKADLYYQIGKQKPVKYNGTFKLRDANTIVAWDKSNEKIKVSSKFSKIETIPLQVISASSQETGEGDASNLVDGNIGSIWHTMYSVTVAQYPHWVDFDASETKSMKGFTYLPRQEGTNGNIKDYKIQISLDGKNWSNPIKEGTFEKNSKLQTVLFDKPVKARYIRFTALSSQNGQDYAAGSEFGVLVE